MGDKNKSVKIKSKRKKKIHKIPTIDTQDVAKNIVRSMYTEDQTTDRNQYALSLWDSVTKNLMIPKSMQSVIQQLRLPVLAALIRHLPIDQMTMFTKDCGDISERDRDKMKEVFMTSNNVLRWVLDHIMSEKKGFARIESIRRLHEERREMEAKVDEAMQNREKYMAQKEAEREEKEKEEKGDDDDGNNNDGDGGNNGNGNVKEQQNGNNDGTQIVIQIETPPKGVVNEENRGSTPVPPPKVITEKVFEDADPEQMRLDEAVADCMFALDKQNAKLAKESKSMMDVSEAFLHKYFSIYCSGNNASRMGFSRSSELLSYSHWIQRISPYISVNGRASV